MRKSTTLNIRVNESLSEFVADNVGEYGSYDNVSEYVRDLIRRDKKRVEAQRFEELKSELQSAFAAPDSEFINVDADDWLARARERNRG